MSARGPMLVQIHRCNLSLAPQVKEVVENYLWGPDAELVMNGKSEWVVEYRASVGEELARALVDVDPSMVLEVDNDDGDYAGVIIHHPDLGWYESATLDGEPCIGRAQVNQLFVDEPTDLMGWLDAAVGNPWYRAIKAIPQDDPNRLTKGDSA